MAATPESAQMVTGLVGRFRELLHGCLRCGQASSLPTCPACAGPTSMAGADAPPPPAPMGLLVEGRSGRRRRQGVAVEVHPKHVTLLLPDGGPTQIAPDYQIRQVPPGIGRVRSPAGALVAATRLDLSDPVRAELRRRTLAQVGGSAAAQRALAADCAALGLPEPLADLPLSDSERTWWQAQSMWTAGDLPGAATALLGLPAGRYPQRLVLWWQAAAGGSVPEAVRPAVAAATRELASGSPAAAVAATLLLRALGERTADAELVGAAHTLAGEHLAPWLAGQLGESSASRLLGARSDGAGAGRLGSDPAILDQAPPAVLDDLIDRGRIPPEWLARRSELSCGRHLASRMSIADLDDASLAELGAHHERARRGLAAGGRLPDDLPPEVVAGFSRLKAAADGDDDALVEVAGAAGLDPGTLRATLAAPTAPPAPELLADGSLARHLLGRSGADPARWPAEGLDQRQREFAAKLALRRAKDLLYQWQWQAAFDAAVTCLRFAREEELRDEAQNLIGAAHWQLGNDSAASAALSAALDGEYTAALQVNFAVVATELEPQQAAAHLSRLVLEAPNLPLRVSAAMQAVRLWRSDQEWQHGQPLPDNLASALRSLVVEPVEYDVFRDLVRLLANHDEAWLGRAGVLDRSPHRGTLAARIWTANARGPEEFVTELAQAVRTAAEDWVTELRDQLVRDLITQLNEPGENSPWGYGVLVLDKDLPMSIEARVALLTLTIPRICDEIDTTEAEPAAKFLDWLERAYRDLEAAPTSQRTELAGVLQLPFSVLAASYIDARRRQLQRVHELYESIRAQVFRIPRHMVNMASVRDASKPGVDLCQETRALMTRLRRHAGPDLARAIDDISTRCAQLLQSFRQL